MSTSVSRPHGLGLLDALRDPARLAVLRATGLVGAGPDAGIERLTRVAARALGATTVRVSLVDDQRQWFCAVTEPEDAPGVRETPLSRSICKLVVHKAEPVVVGDAHDHPGATERMAVLDHGVRSYLGVPIVARGHVLGSFCAVGDEPREWTADDLAVMTELAGATSEILSLRAQRADELIVEALDRAVLASLPDTGVLQLDRALNFTFAEGQGLRAAGWEPELLVGRALADVLPPDGYDELAPRYRAAFAGERVSHELIDPVKPGVCWWLQAAPVYDEDGVARTISVVLRDVTEAREREQALAEREAQYRLLADHSSDVISRHDLLGRFRYASPAAAAAFGHAPAALMGRRLDEVAAPAEREMVRRALIATCESDAPITFRFAADRLDGVPAWMETTATAITDPDGAVRELLCATRDVTARHAAEEAIRVADEFSRTLLEALEESISVVDQSNRIVALNPSAERLVGSLDRVNADREGLEAEDEHGRALTTAEMPAARALATGEPQLGVVVRIRTVSGERRWLRVNAVPLTGDDGSILRVVSSWADITELREAQHHARHQADHDALTGLPNRALLARRLTRALEVARLAQRDLGVLFIDIDRFKVINDSRGHHYGDLLLRAVAERLGCELRGGVDTLARIAGDEFIVVAPHLRGAAEASALAARLLAALREPLRLDGTELSVKASIGVALAAAGSGDGEELLRQADIAMYQVKTDGGAGHRLYEPEMGRRAIQRLSIESALREAIDRDELELHYQPIWALPGRGLQALEALVRWRHPERGLVGPDEFIPVAEQSGLIVELGEWVLKEACGQMRRWQDELPGAALPPVHVNIAARQLAGRGLPARIAALLEANGLAPDRLMLEVTESTVMDRVGETQATLAALRALGVGLSLDDFGTGYSSLSHLQDLPIDVLKLDRSFVKGAEDGTRRQTLLAGIIALAHGLGLRVVAEGVETEAQMDVLERLGCDLVQGFLLARPAPAAAVAPLLR